MKTRSSSSRRLITPVLAAVALVLAGCATAARPKATSFRVSDGTIEAQATGASERGEATMLVESDPAGGVVVVDGYPLGPAPCAVVVPVTEAGYLQREVSVKVRFVAADASTRSFTSTLLLTPVDRVPTRLSFTPTGARRTLVARDG